MTRPTVKAWPADADTMTAELPRGWHRLVWVQDGKPRHIVTTDVNSVIALYSTLCVLRDSDPWAHITEVSEGEYWQPASI